MVVIGGLNRSGKTTFMQVLRHLGYGFSKVGLPPPTFEYDVGADLAVEGSVYGLRLSGYGRPQLKKISGGGEDIADIQSIYHIDAFTYKQLFTISLDELAVARELAGPEQEKLKSILLGAGFKDVMILPKLREEFAKLGESIGGKLGNPNVKKFNLYYTNIKEGQEIKKKALSQIVDYQVTQAELALTDEKIDQLTGELKDKLAQIRRLDVLKNNFDDYKSYLDLGARLVADEEDRWQGGPSEELLAGLKSKLKDLEARQEDLQSQEVRLGLPSETIEQLLAKGNELEALAGEISGIEERIQAWRAVANLKTQKEGDLKKRITKVNADWDIGSLELIKAIKTDTISDRRLNELVEEHRKLEGECQQGATDIGRLQREEEELKKDIGLLTPKKPPLTVKAFIFLMMALAATALVLAFAMPRFLALPLIGAFGVLGVFLWGIRSFKPATVLQSRQDRLRELKGELAMAAEALQAKTENLEKIKDELAVYKKTLWLDSGVSYGFLPNYLLQVRDLQDKICELEDLVKKIKTEKNYLASQYRRYEDFLAPLVGTGTACDSDKEDFSVDKWSPLLANLAKWRQRLTLAREINILTREIADKEKEIKIIMDQAGFPLSSVKEAGAGGKLPTDIPLSHLVAAFEARSRKGLEFKAREEKSAELKRSLLSALRSDAVREAFGLTAPAETTSLLESFRVEYLAYAGKEEVARAYSLVLREEEEKRQKLQRLRDGKQDLANRLKSLAAPDNLHKGQRIIDSNREKLRVLAERYALYMTACFLLARAEKNLLHSMKDDIMASAGRIFNRMTRGEYEGIAPGDSMDFQAVQAAQEELQTIDMLSRGTQEQLYLAVRLSRILDIKPPLPVIIDDSLANFDNPHLGRSLAVLAEVAKTHQIFILTCHPGLLKNVADLGAEVQYWKLIAGQFSLSNYEELIDYLT